MKSTIQEILTKFHKNDIIECLHKHPQYFEDALQLALGDISPYSWRAAWVLWSCMEPNDKRVRKHVKQIIAILPERKSNQQRELLKILEPMEIDENLEGLLYDQCIQLWERTDLQPSVRYNAFKVILKIAKKHPEAADELKSLTEDHYLDSLSRGVKYAIQKMLQKAQVIG